MNAKEIRLECIKAASHLYSGGSHFDPDSRVLDAAQKFEQYILASEEPHFEEETQTKTIPDHNHLPIQHRDGKPPWCNVCRLTEAYQVPKSVFDRGDKPTVHQEPDCVMNNELCTYPEPHKHGFACDKTCPECHGKCHKDCPAHDEYYGVNPGIPK